MSGEPAWMRVPGQGRYAQPEVERRFEVAHLPDGLTGPRRIEDRYLAGTRLRLRHVRAGGRSTFKLTQKVRVAEQDPARVALTNVYLSADEHALLRSLPGHDLVKTRSVWRGDEADWVVDLFHGPLEGLVLAEVEVADLGAPLDLPVWVGREVTHEDRWSGGRLAVGQPSRPGRT